MYNKNIDYQISIDIQKFIKTLLPINVEKIGSISKDIFK
jgi:hypothetical protein